MGRPITEAEQRRAARLGWAYRPANTLNDLAPEVAATGRQSMAEFLLSPQVQRPVSQATEDVAEAARALTVAVGAVDTGDFVSKFDAQVGKPMVVAGNPRVTGRVVNDSDHAAAVEFGNSRVGEGRRILGNAAQPWHTPKTGIG